MKQNNPFAKLGAVDQKLYQETAPKTIVKETEKAPRAKSQNAGIPANQQSSIPARQTSSKLASQNAGKPDIQQAGNIKIPANVTATEKVTYRFHAEGKYAVEDMKTILVRKHDIKASLEEIAEASILMTYEDLLENQHASKLANWLSRIPANKKTS